MFASPEVMAAEIVTLHEENLEMKARLDHVYSERNALAIALAKVAGLAGLRAGRGIDTTPAEGWDPEWLHVVYVELPDGSQVSWHMGPQDVPRLEGLPEFPGQWDGTSLGKNPDWCRFDASTVKWNADRITAQKVGLRKPTVGELVSALQKFPPIFMVDLANCDDVTDVFAVEVLEGSSDDGPGSIWLCDQSN